VVAVQDNPTPGEKPRTRGNEKIKAIVPQVQQNNGGINPSKSGGIK